MPDLALPGLDIPLSALDISSDSSRRSSILFPRSQRSSLSSQPDADNAVRGLIIPSSDSGGAGDLGGFILPSDNPSSAQRSARIGGLLEDEDEGFNLDPGFTIDADGNLIEENTQDLAAAPSVGVRLGSDSAASGRVRQELLEGLEAGQYQVTSRLLSYILNLSSPFPFSLVLRTWTWTSRDLMMKRLFFSMRSLFRKWLLHLI